MAALARGYVPTVRTLLDSVPTKPLALPRSVATLETELRRRALTGELTLPAPATGRTPRRWSALAALGRTDLALARLAEGHVDALAILAEAGRTPARDALYGVWASKADGTGAVIEQDSAGLRCSGLVRFCSGASVLDVDLAAAGVHPDPDSWPALGMDASDSLDVHFRDLMITEEMIVGVDDWYLRRRGFRLGSGGVAAVWLGGATGGYDRVLARLRERGSADEHQLSHLGALATALHGTDALLANTAHAVDSEPGLDLTGSIGLAKAAAERVGRMIVDIAPRITGPGPLCWDRAFAQHLADLAVYIRQHHAERDLAGLGRHLLEHGEGR
jgi:hypothetical protein